MSCLLSNISTVPAEFHLLPLPPGQSRQPAIHISKEAAYCPIINSSLVNCGMLPQCQVPKVAAEMVSALADLYDHWVGHAAGRPPQGTWEPASAFALKHFKILTWLCYDLSNLVFRVFDGKVSQYPPSPILVLKLRHEFAKQCLRMFLGKWHYTAA